VWKRDSGGSVHRGTTKRVESIGFD